MTAGKSQLTVISWLIVAATLTLMTNPVSALDTGEHQPRVWLESVELPDGKVELTVRLCDFDDLAGVNFVVYLDPQCVDVLSAEHGDFPGTTTLNILRASPDTGGLDAIACQLDDYRGHSGDFVMFTAVVEPLRFCGTSPLAFSGVSYGSEPLFVNSSLQLLDVSLTDFGAYALVAPANHETNRAIEPEDSFDEATTNASSSSSAETEFGIPEGVQADLLVVGDLFIAPAHCMPGQQVTISATICNASLEAAPRIVALVVNGAVDQTGTISIRDGACGEVVFNVTRSEAGTYQVAIDGATGEFTVLPLVPPPPPPGDEEAPSPAQTGISTAAILAIIGAMFLLIAVLVFFFRRA